MIGLFYVMLCCQCCIARIGKRVDGDICHGQFQLLCCVVIMILFGGGSCSYWSLLSYVVWWVEIWKVL